MGYTSINTQGWLVLKNSSSEHSVEWFCRDGDVYRIDLADHIAAGKEATIEIQTYFSHSLDPYPSEIRQSEKQLVRFIGNAYFLSPYACTSQTTIVKLASSTVESYTKAPKPVNKNDAEVTYGPYENVKPFSKVCILGTR